MLRDCRLIETWDVLKFGNIFEQQLPQPVINRNMGCIEITKDIKGITHYMD